MASVVDIKLNRSKSKGKRKLLRILVIFPLILLFFFIFDARTAPLDIAFVEHHLSELKEDDPQLIQYTRFQHLTPPSMLPYNLNESWAGDKPDTFSGWVAKFFGYKRGGIFLEAGAHEGEDASHSLYLEKRLGWTGLLVECNPNLVSILKMKQRNAWVADVCLAIKKTPQKVNFSIPVKWTYSGRVGPPNQTQVPENQDGKWKVFKVQAIPLYTLLAALGWKEVDYFSFDIEGQELNVLKLFPFGKVIFKVISSIEVLFSSEEQKRELQDFMKGKGYWFVEKVQKDHLYVHKDFKHRIIHVNN